MVRRGCGSLYLVLSPFEIVKTMFSLPCFHPIVLRTFILPLSHWVFLKICFCELDVCSFVVVRFFYILIISYSFVEVVDRTFLCWKVDGIACCLSDFEFDFDCILLIYWVSTYCTSWVVYLSRHFSWLMLGLRDLCIVEEYFAGENVNVLYT